MIVLNYTRCLICALCFLCFKVTSKPLPTGNAIKKKHNDVILLSDDDSGNTAYRKAKMLFQEEIFDKASEAFWVALMKGSDDKQFTVRYSFSQSFRYNRMPKLIIDIFE